MSEVIDFLTASGANEITFSDYAREHIARMINRGQERNAKNYKLALSHLERYLGTVKVKFENLTSAVIKR